MDPTTMIFTLWIGSFNLRGNNHVYIGKASASDQTCKGVHLVKPTFDADFEVIIEPAKPAANAS